MNRSGRQALGIGDFGLRILDLSEMTNPISNVQSPIPNGPIHGKLPPSLWRAERFVLSGLVELTRF